MTPHSPRSAPSSALNACPGRLRRTGQLAPLLALALVALSGCATPAPPTDRPDPTSTTSGPEITIEISPESLAALSGPDQIAEALSIATVNADGNPLTQGEYVVALAQRLEGLLNSGTTDAEYEAYEGTGNDLYENAMHDKYDAAGLGVLFVSPAEVDWIANNHKGIVHLSATARVLEVDEFKQNVEIILEDAGSESAPAAGAEMVVAITYLSNADELGLTEFYSGTEWEIDSIDRTTRYTLRVVDDGNGHLRARLELID